MLEVMGADKSIVNAGMKFFILVGGFAIFLSIMTNLGAILRATGDTKTPMLVSFYVNIFNIVIDAVLIFGLGPFPKLGIVGAALGTVIARMLGCIILWQKVGKSKVAFPLQQLVQKQNFKPLIKLSIPAAIERLMMRTGDVAVFAIIMAMGANVFAANTIVESIIAFFFMPGFGLATATATLVGNATGRKDFKEVQRINREANIFGIIALTVIGFAFFAFATPLAHLYTHNAFVVHQIWLGMLVVAITQPVVSTTLIFTAALQGMGDTKSPMIATTVGMWILRVILVWVFGLLLHWDIAGVMIATAIDNMARSAYLYYKFKKHLQA
jgi:putative MATE family efflux protein